MLVAANIQPERTLAAAAWFSNGVRLVAARFHLLVLSLLILLGPLPGSAQGAPEQQISRLNDRLLEAMQRAEELGFEGRYELLAAPLIETFDFEEMARASAGSHWSKFDSDERERYVDAFTRMSISTFASRFDGYSGETFELVGEKPGTRGTKMVETRIAVPGEEPVAINYVFRETEEGPRVVDVYLDATYSEIAVKRSEYTSLLRQVGVDGLVAALDRKIAQMKADGGG